MSAFINTRSILHRCRITGLFSAALLCPWSLKRRVTGAAALAERCSSLAWSITAITAIAS